MLPSTRTILCLGLISISIILVQPIPLSRSHQSSVSNPPVSTPPVPAQDIWDNKSFWNYDFDLAIYYIIDAYLLAFGDHCYIYFEDSVITALGTAESFDRAELYRDEFETNIYERVTDLAGNPNGTLGDIDGDPRVYILIMENRMSCYRQTNEIVAEHSNLCEMFYVCYYSYNVLQAIAHEFHHLVWFNYEFDEVHFVLEGGAEYAMYYTGCCTADNLTNRAPYFINDIHDSLIYFEVEAQDYGACYLFTFYLVEQYGLQFLRDLVQHEDDGALGLESALVEAGYPITFNDLYLDWMMALTIDKEGFADNRYCYHDIDSTLQDYSIISSLPFQENEVPLYCYGSKVYQIASPPDSFKVEMTQPADEVAGISIAYKDNHGWHIQKKQNQGKATMFVNGESIDEVYIVTSYLYTDTPDGSIDFGSGSLESVQLSVYEAEMTTSSELPSSTTSTIPTTSTTISVTSGTSSSTQHIIVSTMTTSQPTMKNDILLPIVMGGSLLIAGLVMVLVLVSRRTPHVSE
jgi:hypothetical protein